MKAGVGCHLHHGEGNRPQPSVLEQARSDSVEVWRGLIRRDAIGMALQARSTSLNLGVTSIVGRKPQSIGRSQTELTVCTMPLNADKDQTEKSPSIS